RARAEEQEGDVIDGNRRAHPRAETCHGAIIGATRPSLHCAIRADVAELVDAHGSGPCGGNPVEVQVLSSAWPTTGLWAESDSRAGNVALVPGGRGTPDIFAPHSKFPANVSKIAPSMLRRAAGVAALLLVFVAPARAAT